jgi:hypothetical protein
MSKRRWFGPSKAELWRQLADRVGGEYVESNWGTGDKVVATHGQWTFTLDTYVVPAGEAPIMFTRLRAPYINPESFRFHIYRRGFFTELRKMLGMQDIEIGAEPFDHEFVIKSNDEERVKLLLADPELRRQLSALPEVSLEVKDSEGWFGPSFPDDVDELYFNVAGIIKDVPMLEGVFDLFATTLDRLCEIGSAYADDPEVRVR